MSFDQSRFTLITLPQSVDENGLLQLHILFIPRNFSPLEKVDTEFNLTGALPFIEARPKFIVKVLNKSSNVPGNNNAAEKPLDTAPLEYSPNIENIYRTLKDAVNEEGKPKYFDIDETRSSGQPGSEKHVAPEAFKNRDTAIRKYLPRTYREAFNFTSPRIKNAVTDDSYHCAMREQSPVVKQPNDNKVSWGKVYAHLLRQPVLAMAGGLLYKTTVQLKAGDFEKGGWLYVDLAHDSDYRTELTDSITSVNIPQPSPFTKRYAAKIPYIKAGEKTSLFTAINFPVVNPGGTVDESDELFIEAGRYHHGFATIVHANQPVSQNLLKEDADGLNPQKEIGIRLGWEDEQILIWYLRQMAVEAGKTDRTDAPLCVMGYNIDVRFSGDENPWESLNEVTSNGDMMLENINLGQHTAELPYQVYPTKINTVAASDYWLPMYFANWNNGSIVIPDNAAASIYKNESDSKHPVKNINPYLPPVYNTKLQYGKSYQFRVRLSDISGGGPKVTDPSSQVISESHIADQPFQRYVAPDAVRIMNEADTITYNTDDHNFTGELLQFARPLIGFPGALYTGKYTDAVQRLKDASQAIIDEQEANPGKGGRGFGIADPDVTSISIKVEVETLQMDNLASDDGKQNFITLYTTNRVFAAFDENNADEIVDVPIRFTDDAVLNLGNKIAPFSLDENNTCITATAGEIVLPTARNIRITIMAEANENDLYWGILKNTDGIKEKETRLGKPKLITLLQESKNEQILFTGINNPQLLQGIYLQPDPIDFKQAAATRKDLNGTQPNKLPDIIQRFAEQLKVEAKDKSLYAPNGERIHFWCSSRIRHNMAPDYSSITFVNKNELQNHWLVCTTLTLNRDWSWDSLDPLSFEIERKFRFGADPETMAEKVYQKIGDVELKKTASFQAIQAGADGKIQRGYTKIIFIDVVDGTPVNAAFPDISELQYRIKTNFRPGHEPEKGDAFETKSLLLPVTINPHQAPKLIGAGIALSPYIRNPRYSFTEARKRFLWLEFDQAPQDPNDALFTRILGYAPDQLLSSNNPSLWKLFEDAPINLDPEYIRVITPNMGEDQNGLKAMQKMTKSLDAKRHYYILPLPAGLHAESPELFGFFTCEFRFGHAKIWSTAQARFGLPLRVAGLQYPSPNLSCILNRDEKEISISAPYAQAVFNGQDVTSNPPRTAIWALLYAQVRQADATDYRNILLAELELLPNPIIPELELFIQYLYEKINAIERQKKIDYADGIAIKPYDIVSLFQNIKTQYDIEKQQPLRQANGAWNNTTINQLLDMYGLLEETSLSVVCVEVFGQITNIKEQINNLNFTQITEMVQGNFLAAAQPIQWRIIKDNVLVNNENNYTEMANQFKNEYGVVIAEIGIAREAFSQIKGRPMINPLSENLGKYRILRTSPLTEVPFVCCTEEIENTLGLLSLRGSLINDFAIPDNTSIDGWIFNKTTNTIQCTGDIDNDGLDEIIVTSAAGMAIVKYREGNLRLLFTIKSNAALGDWVYDDAGNIGRDRGFKIGKFTGQPFNELLLISSKGLATLKWEGDTLIPTKILKNGQLFANWKVNTADRLVGIASLFNAAETNIIFENAVDMHIVSMSKPEQTFTARTGIRYGQWFFNRGDNTVQCFGDFDGDGRDEIFISSPWGIGILKWNNGVVTAIAMHINGNNLNGYIVDNKHVFDPAHNSLPGNNEEIVVHNNKQLQAVLVLENGALRAITIPNKNLVLGDLSGEFIAKLDRDEKPDWFFKNDTTLFVVNLDENTGIIINNIIPPNRNINGWKMKATDKFVATGNFLGKEDEQQLLVLAGV